MLDVTVTRLEWFIFEDNRNGLSDSWQLFQIGIILIDIALDGPNTSDPERLEDPHSYAAKRLPLIYKAVHVNYYRACAFCVQERR